MSGPLAGRDLGLHLTNGVLAPMKEAFVGKDEVIDLLGVSLVAGENLFVLGPPVGPSPGAVAVTGRARWGGGCRLSPDASSGTDTAHIGDPLVDVDLTGNILAPDSCPAIATRRALSSKGPEPDAGNLHVRIRGGVGVGNRPGLSRSGPRARLHNARLGPLRDRIVTP
ncbi:MAG: hypothetical protein HY720_14125 [Planctomycetes bacterium]|nr:hypothetical protein [Planctomycetota bacterium]